MPCVSEDTANGSLPLMVAVPVVNMTQEEVIYHGVEKICYGIILPIILSFGVIGNVLNIIVFTRGRFRHTLDDIERSAATGLVALAISDLIFCAVALPAPFLLLPKNHLSTGWLEMMGLYYNIYSDPVLNVFLCSSTWLIVVVSLERYIAVCHPLGARGRIKVWKTVVADVVVYVCSIGFNFPQFHKWEIVMDMCQPGCQCYYSVLTMLYQNSAFRKVYKVLCFFIAGILPFAFLVFCNIRLLLEIYRSRRLTKNQLRDAPDRYCTSRITVILITIIFLYFVLVVPSVFLEFFANFIASTPGNREYYIYRTTIVLTNVGQVLYFAMNFVLYCSLSRPFRENLSSQIPCKNNTTNSVEKKNRYRMVKR